MVTTCESSPPQPLPREDVLISYCHPRPLQQSAPPLFQYFPPRFRTTSQTKLKQGTRECNHTTNSANATKFQFHN